VPSITFLNELLSKAVQGRLNEEEQGLLKHFSAMVTEGADLGVLSHHRDLPNFRTWVDDVQTVMLRSNNDFAQMYWVEAYDAECTEAVANREQTTT
jgi:hypothetical protein